MVYKVIYSGNFLIFFSFVVFVFFSYFVVCYLRISWHYHGLHTSSQDRNKLNQGTTCDTCDVETTFSGTCSVTECVTTTTTAIATTRTRTAAAGLDCATARLVACSAAATVGVAVGAATATATAAVTPTSTSPNYAHRLIMDA